MEVMLRWLCGLIREELRICLHGLEIDCLSIDNLLLFAQFCLTLYPSPLLSLYGCLRFSLFTLFYPPFILQSFTYLEICIMYNSQCPFTSGF